VSSVDSVALTFDDGPHPVWTPRLLDVLDELRVRATFFLIGERAAEHPRLVLRIVDAGHMLGNHTMRHPAHLATMPAHLARREIDEAQDAIAQAAGRPATLFRAPEGSWSRMVLDLAREAGLEPVDWGVDPKDWREPQNPRIGARIMRSRAGDVVLCHDGGGDRSLTVAAVAAAVPVLRGRGLYFTTLQPPEGGNRTVQVPARQPRSSGHCERQALRPVVGGRSGIEEGVPKRPDLA
jgi:peptidoglycan/xylan/chitin deacetylase (PgdA/CDA1 family)